jgi:hypothetical protein
MKSAWGKEAAIGILENAQLTQQLLKACPGITSIKDLIKRARVTTRSILRMNP